MTAFEAHVNELTRGFTERLLAAARGATVEEELADLVRGGVALVAPKPAPKRRRRRDVPKERTPRKAKRVALGTRVEPAPKRKAKRRGRARTPVPSMLFGGSPAAEEE